VTPETDDKRCVKEGKMGEEKDNCSDSALLGRAGKILVRTVGIPSGRANKSLSLHGKHRAFYF